MVLERPPYLISTDLERLQPNVIADFLATSYWADKRSRELVLKSLQHSLNFGLFHRPSGVQVGFARVVADYATFAYLADVFVLEEHRHKGLGRWLLEAVTSHPEVRDLRRWHLVTWDAQSLYQQMGFAAIEHPERHMERLNPNT